MSEWLYQAVTNALNPVATIVVSAVVRGDRRERDERLGRCTARGLEGAIWIHAASAGETEGAEPIAREIRKRFPQRAILLTSMTRAGKKRAERVESVHSLFAPLDLPGPLSRALTRVRPSLLLLVETEIWPNLLRKATGAGCPAVIANGRLSQRAARRMVWAGSLYRSALRRLSLLGVQREIDRERFLRFGVPGDRIFVHGSTKVDSEPAGARPLPIRRGEGERWVVFGSIRPGEEGAVLTAARKVLQARPDSRVVVAPRHPEQTTPFRNGHGIDWQRWSGGEPGRSRAIWVDTVGDLVSFYRLADVAFVGGTLSKHGGHNPVEPARFGVPVLLGPNLDNCRELADILIESEGAEVVTSGEALAERILFLIDHDDERRRRGEAGRQAIEAHRGASARCVDRLAQEGLFDGEAG